MSALQQARGTPKKPGNSSLRSYPILAATTIWQGSIVVVDSDGYAKPGVTATGLKCVGVANTSVVNSGASGAANITVDEGIYQVGNGDGITIANVGDLCYISDDQTVTKGNTNQSICGVISAVDSAGVWVAMGLDAAPLPADLSALAATGSASGAKLVGIYDSAGKYTGATVEAALSEATTSAALGSVSTGLGASMVGIEDANANTSVATVEAALTELYEMPKCVLSIPMVLSSLALNRTVLRFKPGFKCKIVGTSVQNTTAATTGSKQMKLSPFISSVAVTGGDMQFSTANMSVAGVLFDGTAITANNTVSAAAEVTVVVTTSTAAFSEGAANVNVIFGKA